MADSNLKDRVDGLEYDFQVVSDKLEDLKGQVEMLPRVLLTEVRQIVRASEERISKKISNAEARLLEAIQELKRNG